MARARPGLDVRWSRERAVFIERGIARRRRRQQVGRAVMAAAAVLAAGVWGVRLATVDRDAELVAEQGSRLARPGSTVRFADGSIATLLGPDSALTPLELSETLVRSSVDQGAVRFSVTRRPSRLFQVSVGSVTVEVVGTQFVVERRAEEVDVSVEEGHVRVRGPSGESVLGPGDRAHLRLSPAPAGSAATAPGLDGPGSLPPSGEAPSEGELATAPGQVDAPAAAGEPGSTPAGTAAPATGTRPQVGSTRGTRGPGRGTGTHRAPSRWKELARSGDYVAAHDALGGGLEDVANTTEELLLAADVARLSQNPEQAVRPLRRILRDHRFDPQAPLAAFTLGRVLLDELGKNADAADAFATAVALAPNGPLAEDALAREIEARARSGDRQRAHELAKQYERKYPNGRRLQAVRKFGALE